ncbi:hypothetical protein EV421DRAFT_1913211 [Armillaria borealis]|uniref:Uncharacterized protein n=1 Tax=Armillaria borealis TaxID=47425 RepID=A0AA39IUQ1_9AGAR|nr:hypothetical protein EV421DRAFT_1913211 [Armillaria borealis]
MSGSNTRTKAKGGQSRTTASNPQNATTLGPAAQTTRKTKNSNRTPLPVMEEPKKRAQDATRNQGRTTGKSVDHQTGQVGEGDVHTAQHKRGGMTSPLTDVPTNEVEIKPELRPDSTLEGSPVVVPTPMGSRASPTVAQPGYDNLPGAFGSNNERRRQVGLENDAPVNRNWCQYNNEEHDSEEQEASEDSSEQEESSGSESENERPSELDEDPTPVQDLHEALRSDCAAYELATREDGEWANPQVDAVQVQEVLSGMNDEQRAVVRVLAHRQTHVALRMMGVSNIDPESEAYLQQYNITVVSIVGGSILQSQEDARATSQNQGQDNTSETFNDQLRNAAAQFGRPHTAPRPHLFDFSGASRNPSRLGTPSATSKPTPNGVGKTLKDRAILQKWRERDMAESGQSNIPDQGIVWDNKGEAREADQRRGASRESSHPQEPPRPPPRDPNPPGGPGGPDDSDDGESEDETPRRNNRTRRGNENHGHSGHRLPEGVKPPQLDIKSVKPYDGDPSMEVLWDWLKSLVIHLETQQLGGPDRDRERKLIIEPVLTGKAKKWYHDHVIEVDSARIWTFTSVILALYDRFIHDSVMQEARSKFEKATFAEGGGTVEGFRDLLESYIRNMTMKPDDYTVRKLFMKRIPHAMRNAILEDHLRMELNTLDELVLSGKAWEDTEHSKKEYAGKETPLTHRLGDRTPGPRDQSRLFLGTRVFLWPKGTHPNRNNHREPDRARLRFSTNMGNGEG